MYEKYTIMLTEEEIIDESAIITLTISKEEVETLDCTKIEKILETLSIHQCEKSNRFVVGFEYDNDSREIYEIPEICKYIKTVFGKHKYMFYYIVSSESPGRVFFYCLAGVRVVGTNGGNAQFVPKDIGEFVKTAKDIKQNTLDYSNLIGCEDQGNMIIDNLGLDRFIN